MYHCICKIIRVVKVVVVLSEFTPVALMFSFQVLLANKVKYLTFHGASNGVTLCIIRVTHLFLEMARKFLS